MINLKLGFIVLLHAACHQRGIYFMLDVVANHMGIPNNYDFSQLVCVAPKQIESNCMKFFFKRCLLEHITIMLHPSDWTPPILVAIQWIPVLSLVQLLSKQLLDSRFHQPKSSRNLSLGWFTSTSLDWIGSWNVDWHVSDHCYSPQDLDQNNAFVRSTLKSWVSTIDGVGSWNRSAWERTEHTRHDQLQ